MKWIVTIVLLSVAQLVSADSRQLVNNYIDDYKAIAVSEMHRSGIPASIKLAQGMLESNFGRSTLARQANNHFGIKCGRSWTGGTYYRHDDDRNKKGELIKSCFRSFDDAYEAYIAHSDFLTDTKKAYRYGFLFELDPTDYKSWAKGLKSSGYASDPKYSHKLIQIIEKYGLHEYDQDLSSRSSIQVAASSPKPQPSVRNSTLKHSVTTTTKTKARRGRYTITVHNKVRALKTYGGESLKEISRKTGVATQDLIKYNEIYNQKEDVVDADVYIYLERKKRKRYDDVVHHIVKDGETMGSIAQLYGIRLASLYAKNRMPKGSTTVVGARLYLKETATVHQAPRYREAQAEEELLFVHDDTVK